MVYRPVEKIGGRNAPVKTAEIYVVIISAYAVYIIGPAAIIDAAARAREHGCLLDAVKIDFVPVEAVGNENDIMPFAVVDGGGAIYQVPVPTASCKVPSHF